MDADFSTLKVTRGIPELVDAIAPLFDAYRQFYRKPADLAGAHSFIAERLKRDESVLFVAFVQCGTNSQAVGFVQLYPVFSSLSMRPQWILSDLYVVPEARKQGAGAALMNRARELARATGADGLMLETAVDNLNAQKLYEALDYKRDEEFYRYFLAV